ncbi:MAG: hypothetical protein Q7U34_01375, partial [Anaerolineales bacterium]|nr:hypothetical protein [Anaerolineales bacterium]
LFVDNRFEFVPIPEQRYKTDRDCLTYGTLRQFYEPTKPLLDLFQKSPVSPELKVHSDPEFLTLTYGDNIKKKTNLQRLQRGDFLFFLARLVPFNNGQFNHSKANFALIGYLQIEEILKESHSSIFDSPVFNQSVHFGRWKADESSFDNFAIFKGSTRSLRFYFAVPFNRRLVELVPILKADNSHWDWKRTTELGTIGANTRAARMHIDPNVNKERAQRFWQHIYNAQKWSSGRHNSKPCG